MSMLAIAAPAFASSSISNVRFDNNQTQTSCTPGQTVNVTFRVTVPAGEVAELGQVDVIGDNLAPALPISLGDDLGLQEGPHDVTANVTCPQNSGYYAVQYQTAGIYGGLRSTTMTDGVVSTGTFGNAIRVGSVSTDTTSTGTVPAWQSAIDALTAQIAAIAKLVTPASGSTAPAASSMCSEFNADAAGLYQGSTGDGVAKLQAFLLSKNPNSIPLIRSGAATYGYFGPQTAGAVSAFRTGNGC